MDEVARREWLGVAWKTIGHLPSDLLKIGAEEARRVADHPAKIVPAIMKTTHEQMESREQSADEYKRDFVPEPVDENTRLNGLMDRRGKPMSEEDTTTLNAFLAERGLAARYRPDGTRYKLTAGGGQWVAQ